MSIARPYRHTLFALSIAAAAITAPWAHAQSPAPVGTWIGENTGDVIQIGANGHCVSKSKAFSFGVAGACEWLSTSTGGVLNITYQLVRGPARLAYSIRWLDTSTLLVNGTERFRRG